MAKQPKPTKFAGALAGADALYGKSNIPKSSMFSGTIKSGGVSRPSMTPKSVLVTKVGKKK